MVDHIDAHRPRSPRHRLTATDAGLVFYPGEAARILGLAGDTGGGHIDYAQLRRLYRFVREQAGTEIPDGWSKFTFTDLLAARVVVRLVGGSDAFVPPRRLRLDAVQRACERLRALGFERPLIEVPLERVGSRILAVVDGAVLEPASGQALIDGAVESIAAFLAESEREGHVATLHDEARRVRRRSSIPVPRARAAVWLELSGAE